MKNADNKILAQKLDHSRKTIEELKRDLELNLEKTKKQEKEFEEMRIRFEGTIKTNEIQIKMLTCKLEDCEQLLATEKDAREKWI